MSSLAERIAHRLKKARSAARLTQEELARAANVTSTHVSRLERAVIEHPRRTELEGVATVLGLTTDDLMGITNGTGEGEPLPDPEGNNILDSSTR